MAYSIEDVYKLCSEINLKCLSTEYKGIKNNLVFICTECGEKFERNFDNLKTRKSTICNKCGKKKANTNRVFTYDYIKNEINKSGCVLVSDEYINVDSKLKIKCQCGDIFETTFYKFDKNGKRQCNECGKRILANKIAIQEKEIIELLDEDGYTLLDRQINGKDQRIYIKCNKGHEPYWVNLSKYKSAGRRCPHCQNSRGEKKIENVLKNKNINFVTQYKFKGLIGIGGGLLRFDFAVLDKENNLQYLLEYDGEMHYEETGVGNNLEKQKHHDNIKNKYCKDNNIELIRIPFGILRT